MVILLTACLKIVAKILLNAHAVHSLRYLIKALSTRHGSWIADESQRIQQAGRLFTQT